MIEIALFGAVMFVIAAILSNLELMRGRPMFFGSLLLISALALLAFGLFFLWPGRWWFGKCRDSCADVAVLWTWFGLIPTLMIFITSLRLLRYKHWRYIASVSAMFCLVPLTCIAYLMIRDYRDYKLDQAKEASLKPYCEMLESNGKFFAQYLHERVLKYPFEFESPTPHGTIKQDFVPFCKAAEGCNTDYFTYNSYEQDLEGMGQFPVDYIIGVQLIDGAKLLHINSGQGQCKFVIPYELLN